MEGKFNKYIEIEGKQIMQSNLSRNPRPKTKTQVCLSIDKKLYEQFKPVAKKYMQPKSAIVENAINRYVQSKIWETDILQKNMWCLWILVDRSGWSRSPVSPMLEERFNN